MRQFDIAFGYCTVDDSTLVIERDNPEEMGRWGVFREGLEMNLTYRPWATVVYLGVMLGLGVVFGGLLWYLYASNPAVAPLVGGLGFFGLTVVAGSLELGYRRGMRARRRLRNTLVEEYTVAYSDRIPLDEITGVTVRSVSTGLFLSDGRQFLVHSRREQGEQTTPLGFPELMNEEQSTARRIFEDHGIDITHDE